MTKRTKEIRGVYASSSRGSKEFHRPRLPEIRQASQLVSGVRQQCIEENLERAERLSAPFRPETQQDDVPRVELHVECGGLSIQVLFANEIPGQERRSGLLIRRQHAARESFRGLEHRAAVDEDRRRDGLESWLPAAQFSASVSRPMSSRPSAKRSVTSRGSGL